jgi:tRNA-dihydrouridine synthase C
MEGVVDAMMRDMLTRIGGYDRCVTEFIRVSERCLPRHVFIRFCPELLNNSRTPAGIPVYLQLLGGNPAIMAANASKAASLGAAGIDINFGCPSKTVNKSDGGSIILREPERVHDILTAVRAAVPSTIPVTAKIRLGYDNTDTLSAIADAVESSEINELCIHARTKLNGYKPPAFWKQVATIRHRLSMPVIINGEIWNSSDAKMAKEQSGCDDLMLGRGAISFPDLALSIQHNLSPEQPNGSNCQTYQPLPWQDILLWLQNHSQLSHEQVPKYAANRTKQWLIYLKRQYPEAAILFEQVKRCRTVPEMISLFQLSSSAISHSAISSA